MSRTKQPQVEPPLARAARLSLAVFAGFALAHSGVTPEQVFAFALENLETLLTIAGLGTLAAHRPAARIQQWIESPVVRRVVQKLTGPGAQK